MFCRKCGKQIPDDSEFCYKCGVRVVSIDDNSERVVTPAPVDNVAERAAENPKINLDKPETSEQQQTVIFDKPFSPIIKNGEKICPRCGNKVTAPWCVYCGAGSSSETYNTSAQIPSTKSLDKPETSQNQQNDSEKDSAVEITSRRCEFCGKEVFSNEPKCSRCNAPNPEFDRIHFTAPVIESHSNTSSKDHNNLNQSISLESSNTMSQKSPTVTPKKQKSCPRCGKPVVMNRETCPYCGEEYTAVPANMKEEKYGQFRKITLGIGWGLTVLWYLIVSEISGFGELMGYVGGGIGFIAFVSFLISFSWGPAVIIVIRKIILCVMCVTKFRPEFRMEHEQISGIRYIVASILGFIITGPMCGGCRNDMEGAVSVALYLAIPLLAVGITSFICYGVLKKAAGKHK